MIHGHGLMVSEGSESNAYICTGEITAYMGQTEKWLEICPVTMNLDETKWDRIPPMSRTFLGGVPGPSGANLGDLGGEGVGGPCAL